MLSNEETPVERNDDITGTSSRRHLQGRFEENIRKADAKYGCLDLFWLIKSVREQLEAEVSRLLVKHSRDINPPHVCDADGNNNTPLADGSRQHASALANS